ncbi:MAG: flavodoxin-dependent (E)-4-hydroxy-3-methylbut-2-enyl-diphosphate synthase [Nanoarchaeota archaeon]|nr:flavodoxin-dependent (E)-4-hydroxy-3-methylbut-2-enyl-diphosphate synthase [Nanoarchaeota archaeon]
MLVKRRKTKEIKVGNVKLGGNNPIRVQSMCSTKTKDIDATIKQIHSLEETGCELIRIAVPDIESVKKIKKIKQQINIPLIADVHYNYKLALESLKQGVDKIRINPGNIPEDELKLIVKEAKDADKPIRIGINIGSLPKNITQKLGFTSEAMFKAALDTVDTFENLDFRNIVVSLKSSDIFQTIEANRLFSEKSDYPLHLGITEAGTIKSGIAKSSIGLGYLLIKGIGDTIRVSLTADPTEEVLTAYNILKSLNLRKGATVISCPTCGRAEIDVINIAEEIEKRLIKIEKPIKVGVLGCFVNVEEAKMADVGIAGAEKYGIIFKKGKIIRKVEKENLIEEILKEIY